LMLQRTACSSMFIHPYTLKLIDAQTSIRLFLGHHDGI